MYKLRGPGATQLNAYNANKIMKARSQVKQEKTAFPVNINLSIRAVV